MREKDLLGGKGANLAEMTNLGLPVPPGFTITTEACRHYLEHGSEPEDLADEVARHLADLEQAMGRQPRRPGGPASGLGAVRGEVLDARDDGDGPRHRAERRIRARPGPAERRPALRVRLLPSAAADVRQHGDGRPLRCLRRDPRRGQGGARRSPGRGPLPRGPRAPGRSLPGADREGGGTPVPPGPARPGGPRGAGGLRLLEHRAGRALPPPGRHPGGPRHRRQRAGHGVRQPRPQLRLGRVLHPGPRHRQAGDLRRLPAERPG